MQDINDDYKGHIIFTHASGPTSGPWVASYSAWKIEPKKSYHFFIQDTVPGVFPSTGSAHAAANIKAKCHLDALLEPAQGRNSEP